MRATGTDGHNGFKSAPGTAHSGQSGSVPVILTGNFGAKTSDTGEDKNRTKPTKKARSEGLSDRASGMETKGFEPSTSALRTHETVVLSEDLSEVTATAAKVRPCVCPEGYKDDDATIENSEPESDFTAAVLMIASLPLSDTEKAEAVRNLLACHSETP
jgi:hypothetical protein